MRRLWFALLLPIGFTAIAGCGHCHERVVAYDDYHHRPHRVYREREFATVYDRHGPEYREHHEHHRHYDHD